MRPLPVFLTAVLLCLSTPTFAQPSAERDAAFQRMKAALECSALAARTGGPIREMASPLFVYASQVGRPVIRQLAIELKELVKPDASTPLAPILSSQSEDFYLGLYFAEASQVITATLEQAAPYGGGRAFDQVMATREAVAATEFNKRNCGLIVPPK